MVICTFKFTWCIDWPAVMVILPSCRLLEVQKAENGNKWPETIAVVLWGTDNIKTYGESLAQVRRQGGQIHVKIIAASKPKYSAVASIFLIHMSSGFQERDALSASSRTTVVATTYSPLLLTQTPMAHGQVMMMVGVAPVADALGRVNKLQVIPLEELGRPRVDVVVNCSGVFRDLFVNQMNLLDRAIKMAAEQDEPEEMNFVRKHAREQARRLLSWP